MQERVESDQIENFIVHEPLDRFIINSHAFHNAHLLRATLPRDLVAPILLFDQRREKHDEFAATLRANWASKAAKRKAGKASGKKKAGRKRKAPVQPNNDNEDEGSGPRNKRRRKEPAQESPAPLPEDQGLVAGRPKRTITRTERAKAADDDSDEGEDSEESSSEDGDMYISSDEDSD
jgi:hypothetical protein